MFEVYLFYQLARQPPQALTRRLVCQGLTIATSGRHQCPDRVGRTSGKD